MLNVSKMIKSAEEALGWPYVSPGTNDKNGIDCSGLFVKIYKDQGASIYHGSNRIFRKYCSETGKLTSVSQLLPGMAVFKWKNQQPKGYDDNLGDFSHIGLVVSANPLRIIHASTEGMKVKEDTKLGKWAYWGKLKDVIYESGGSEPFMPEVTATVFAQSGSSVKMRSEPSTASNKYWDIPIGSVVQVLEKGETWSTISYGSRSGFMMTKFLAFDNEPTSENQILLDKEVLMEAYKKIESVYDLIGDLLGLRG